MVRGHFAWFNQFCSQAWHSLVLNTQKKRAKQKYTDNAVLKHKVAFLYLNKLILNNNMRKSNTSSLYMYSSLEGFETQQSN